MDTHHSSARTCIRSFIWLQILSAFQKEEVKIVYSLYSTWTIAVLCIPLTLLRRK